MYELLCQPYLYVVGISNKKGQKPFPPAAVIPHKNCPWGRFVKFAQFCQSAYYAVVMHVYVHKMMMVVALLQKNFLALHKAKGNFAPSLHPTFFLWKFWGLVYLVNFDILGNIAGVLPLPAVHLPPFLPILYDVAATSKFFGTT